MSTYPKKTDEERKKEIENLTSKIEEGVEKYTETPEQLKEYLAFMSKFYNYSLSNSFLMQEQFKGAMAVGSFKFWKDKGFSVNKGEKGIKILVPNKLTPKFLDENGKWIPLNNAAASQKEKIEKGELKKAGSKLYFSIGNVFDICQTNAKAEDLPNIFPNKWLEGNIKDYSVLYKGLENIANSIGVRIIEPKIELGVSKGCSYTLTKEVALNPRNSELQNFKTLLHELAHAKLHTIETNKKYNSAEKEFQAELTAFTVCSYFNIDTSEYSLNYLNYWSGEEIRDKQNLLKEVHSTVKEYIEVLEETLIKEKEKVIMKDKIKNDFSELTEEKYIYSLSNSINIYNVTTFGEVKTILIENYTNLFKDDIKAIGKYSKALENISEGELLLHCEIAGFEVNPELPEFEKYERNDISKLLNTFIDDENEFNTTFKASSLRISNDKNPNDYIIVSAYDYSITYTIYKENIEILEIDSYDYETPYDLIKDVYRISDIRDLSIKAENTLSDTLSLDITKENSLNIQAPEEGRLLSSSDKLKEYEIKENMKLKDGSFIEKGTCFLIAGFDNGKYELHFQIKEENKYIPNDGIGDGYYFYENEISKFANLSECRVISNNQEVKELVKDKEGDSEMISQSKEKEVLQKIKDHEEWINSHGSKGKQLNLENENLSGMRFLDLDLRNANLKNTDLSGCIFFADLKGANLTGAKIENTKWTGSNLGKITIEANKLNLIEYQIKQELDKHKLDNKGLSTNIKKQKLEKDI